LDDLFLKENHMKILVKYYAEYTAVVEVGDDISVQDAVNGIDVPEGGRDHSRYVENSFEPISVQDEQGNTVDPLCYAK